MVNVMTMPGEGGAGMDDRCDNRTEAAAASSAEVRPISNNASESALWRDYLTSVLSLPIIRQEIEHEVQTTA
jgi:hypothetical protein